MLIFILLTSKVFTWINFIYVISCFITAQGFISLIKDV